jgi:glycosyltransferase involved in cell wall biosynthesis
MRVCLLNDSFPPIIDGVANVVMNYGRIMTETLGDQVVVGTPKYPDVDYSGYPYEVVAYPSINTTELVEGYRAGNPLSIRGIAQLSKFEPDIIHTHCPAASTIMARVLQKEVNVPVVFTYHTKFDVDIARAVGEGFLKRETIKAMVSNISACDEVWVVSHGAGENLRSLGYEGDYRVVSNGVDFPKGRASEALVKEVTDEYDLPEGTVVFLFVGRIMKYKGIPIIIDALKELSDKGIDFRMVFVGGGPDLEEIKEKTKDYALTDKVIFTGPIYDREKLRAWNTRADLFLFPSVYDTNGIVVREAAACGLASVLIKDSCAAEGITHDRNGFIIEENSNSMASLLEAVSKDLPHLADVGQHAMDEIYISWEDSVRDAKNRYAEIIQMSKDGVLPSKKWSGTELLLDSASKIISGTEQVFDVSRSFHEGMRENFEEFRDGVRDIKNDIHEELNEIREKIDGFIS